MPEPLLKIQNLTFSLGKEKILNNLSLSLERFEVVTLIGWSGAGKTTLFKILTGIHPPEQGTITFAGELTESISYMNQEDSLLPVRTVLGNLLLLTDIGKPSFSNSPLQQEALSLLADIGLEKSVNLYPDQLSGGMRQKVSLARALFQKRPLLLLDEPFEGLDLVLREQIYELLSKIKDKLGCTILLMTHDFREALCLTDRILLMHEGSIHKSWTIENRTRQDPLISERMIEEIHRELLLLKSPNMD